MRLVEEYKDESELRDTLEVLYQNIMYAQDRILKLNIELDKLEKVERKRRKHHLIKRKEKELSTCKVQEKIFKVAFYGVSKSTPMMMSSYCCPACDFPIDTYVTTDASKDAYHYCPMCGQKLKRDSEKIASI